MASESRKLAVLQTLKFGRQVAEDEGGDLAKYFVETPDWKRLVAGDVDVVYGQKGAGKSALYALLLNREHDLAMRSIVVVAAENVRGTTAFQELKSDPPPTEVEFVGLWKMYLLSLIGDHFAKEAFDDADAKKVVDALRADGLMRDDRTLQSLLRSVADYVRNLIRFKSVEGAIGITEPHTGTPVGFSGKIVMREPSKEELSKGVIGIDSLFDAANKSLAAWGHTIWILIDRLDVAFAEAVGLEENALRALFKSYLDLLGKENIRLKIFLRSDIWNRITEAGFREASHITRHLTIEWDRASLQDLIVRRALQNQPLLDFYMVNGEAVLGSASERNIFFNRLFYERADPGTNKPKTLDWIISRTRDGSQVTAPREVVHLLNEAVAIQTKKLELGEDEPEGELLFSRAALKEALPKVSKVRIEQTIYAEFPALKSAVEALRDEKSLQNASTLARIWNCTDDAALETAAQLVKIGVFERRGTKHDPQFWIPFLYRGYLGVSQGTAETDDEDE